MKSNNDLGTDLHNLNRYISLKIRPTKFFNKNNILVNELIAIQVNLRVSYIRILQSNCANRRLVRCSICLWFSFLARHLRTRKGRVKIALPLDMMCHRVLVTATSTLGPVNLFLCSYPY